MKTTIIEIHSDELVNRWEARQLIGNFLDGPMKDFINHNGGKPIKSLTLERVSVPGTMTMDRVVVEHEPV